MAWAKQLSGVSSFYLYLQVLLGWCFAFMNGTSLFSLHVIEAKSHCLVTVHYIVLPCIILYVHYMLTLHYITCMYITLHCTGSVCHPVAVNLLQYRCITFRLTLTGKKMSAGLLLLLVCIALHWRWAGGSKVLEALLLLLLSVGQYLAMPHLCIDW